MDAVFEQQSITSQLLVATEVLTAWQSHPDNCQKDGFH